LIAVAFIGIGKLENYRHESGELGAGSQKGGR
jgi:hypothetical protein